MKNTHIEHPEDSILTGDLSVLDWFCSMKGAKASLKIDGAPAVVWGTNPATGNFFVGTKSVFNKVKLKINESHEDIDFHYEGNVANILHACFEYLPRTNDPRFQYLSVRTVGALSRRRTMRNSEWSRSILNR